MHWPPLPPGNIAGTHFCHSMSRLQGHSAFRRIMSMKNSSDPFGNRTRDLPACSAVFSRTWIWKVNRPDLYQALTPGGWPQGRIKLFGAPRQWKHFRPLFQAVFLSGGRGCYPPPPDWVKHHATQSQDRNNKYFILYIEFCINNNI